MSLPTETDVVVIGAGPAGSSAAALLHRAGLRTLVVERDAFPRFQIGESLLPRCMDLLEEAGLLDAIEERGFLIKRGALFLRDDERCSFDFADQFTEGWAWTWQVKRAEFDQILATTAEGMGIPFFYHHEVVAMTPDTGAGPVTRVRTPEGTEVDVRSRWVIDASGYGRVLPRLLGLDAPSGQRFRRAVFTHVRGDRRPTGHDEGRIWICIHPEGAWLWVIPFSDGTTSVGVVAHDDFWARHWDDDPETALRNGLAGEPNAAARLTDMVPIMPARVLQGYSATVSRVHGPGYCLVGNATEFLDPVFSSGVTLALESANRAAHTVIRTLRGETVDWEAEYAEHMRAGIDVFRTYVNGWYDGTLARIFFAAEPNPEFKRQICSVLAGYVWDRTNPCVAQHQRRVQQIARLADMAA